MSKGIPSMDGSRHNDDIELMAKAKHYDNAHGHIAIIKEGDDPVAIRISIGGKKDVGYYCTYRGDLEDVKKVLWIIADSLNSHKE